MKNNKVELILNIVALTCSTLALILNMRAGINIKDPMFWLLIAIALSSVTSIVKMNLKPKSTKIKK